MPAKTNNAIAIIIPIIKTSLFIIPHNYRNYNKKILALIIDEKY